MGSIQNPLVMLEEVSLALGTNREFNLDPFGSDPFTEKQEQQRKEFSVLGNIFTNGKEILAI